MNKLYSKQICRTSNKTGVSSGYYYFFVMWDKDVNTRPFMMDVTKTCYEYNTIRFRWNKKYDAIVAYTAQDVLNGLKTWMSDNDVWYCGVV